MENAHREYVIARLGTWQYAQRDGTAVYVAALQGAVEHVQGIMSEGASLATIKHRLTVEHGKVLAMHGDAIRANLSHGVLCALNANREAYNIALFAIDNYGK